MCESIRWLGVDRMTATGSPEGHPVRERKRGRVEENLTGHFNE